MAFHTFDISVGVGAFVIELSDLSSFLSIYEGADRVRGRGEKRGRRGGEEGEGGGRRGGGRREKRRREKRGWEEGEGRGKGGRGKEENFARAKRAPLQKGGRRRGGGRGEERGGRGERPTPCPPPHISVINYRDMEVGDTQSLKSKWRDPVFKRIGFCLIDTHPFLSYLK